MYMLIGKGEIIYTRV